MSWEGYRQVPYERMGSLVSYFPEEKLPQGVSPDCRNVRYTMSTVATRFGVAQAIRTGVAAAINGIGALIRTGTATPYTTLIFHSDGQLVKETPVGSGSVVAITSPQITPPASTYMELTATFQRVYMTFGDLQSGIGQPAVYNNSTLDPWSMRPLGEQWQANTAYQIGEVISPVTVNNHIYRCTVAGTSGATPPAFPTADHATVASGTATFQEANITAGNLLPVPPAPGLTEVLAGGAFAAGRDVYVQVTLVNGQGESLWSTSSIIVNTLLNDAVLVTSPTVPSWLSTLAAPNAVTGYNVYEADVATSTAAPAEATYKKVNGGVVAIGVNTTISTTGAGAAPPLTNTARIVGGGTVPAGVRYGVVLFVNRNGYISGATNQAIFSVNLDISTKAVFVGNIPIGPSNTVSRIVAFGPALGSVGGPFLYIPKQDFAAGVLEDATVIPDNISTSVFLTFDDNYLQNATDVTNNLRKIFLPPQAHCRYISKWHRIATFGEVGQPSLVRLSEADDPETFYGDTGFFYVSRDDGERAITAVEYRGDVYLFKERSFYTVTENDQDPSTWSIIPRWKKFGVSGPRAVDAGSDFIAFANRTGAYVYDGQTPTWVSFEIQDIWEQINWTYGHLISVHIDQDKKEIRFLVPFLQSTVPNVSLTMNFERGTVAPIYFSHYTGKEIALPEARKWSIDDLNATQAIRVERPLPSPNPNDPTNEEFQVSQILLAINSNEGLVGVITPDTYTDYGQAIDSHYDLASVGLGDSVCRIGGVSIAARGQGNLLLDLLPYRGPSSPLKLIELTIDSPQFYRRQMRKTGRQWGVRFANDASSAGSWFELMAAYLYLSPMWPAETSNAR